MSCTACGFESPPGFAFCGKCGAALAPEPAATPVAEAERAPRDYTPRHLADKILTQRSALEGERKQVTVLFCDVRRSLELSESVDPEDWHRMMDRFLEILASGVHRFEGTVNQYTGDGIMALFGAPIAHEDHAQRACYAALRIRAALERYFGELRHERGLDLAVRLGMNSGDVVVGKTGDDLRMDYTAQGHTVGLAARVEQAAAADRIYLSGATSELVRGYFELDDLGAFQLKGVSQPAPVSELTGVGAVRTRLDVSRARGLSRFVGRAEEMAALETALTRGSEGQPRVIGIVAEAGAGKSRLCFEFLERCRARGVPSFEAHGVAHGAATPLVPILELYRGFYDITDRDTDQQAREKIAGRLVLLDDSLREEIPLMCDFLGVPDPERPAERMDPEARQRRLFDLLRRIVQTVGRQQTTVTVLEDLHWFDGASDAFLDAFVSAVPGTKGVLIVNFRPAYHAEWMAKTYYQQISLLPLGPEAIRELLDDLLGDDASLVGLAEHIQQRTAGNPFFIEEVVLSLAESGVLEGSRGAYRLTRPVAEIAVPDSVRAVLAARIDRQGEREKQLLQTAAVIGKTFSERVLLAVGGLAEGELRDSLALLERGEFVYESALYPELEYSFKHPLTQDVAYETQLSDRRRPIHAAVARALLELAERQAGHVDEQAALLAHHWECAGELRRALALFRSMNAPVRVRELEARLGEDA